jgi:hypothetical protein
MLWNRQDLLLVASCRETLLGAQRRHRAGEVPRARVARYVGAARAIDGDPALRAFARVPAHVGRVDERGARPRQYCQLRDLGKPKRTEGQKRRRDG